MIRFVHTADLHLDQTFNKIAAKDSNLAQNLSLATAESFQRLVDTAINEQVDFMIIAGDAYDGERASLKAQFFFEREMERLATANIPVYLSYGNHDYVKDPSHRLQLPDNVNVFASDGTTFIYESTNGDQVAISGFSYDKRWIEDSQMGHFPDRQGEVDFHIGVYHGDMSRKSAGKQYAPFNLAELRQHGYDYWALGHIHQRQQLSANPPTYYPGNIQGANFKELGPKGALLVSLQVGQKAELEFIESSDWQFIETVKELQPITSLEALRDQIERGLHEQIMYAKEEGLNLIGRLRFQSNGDEETLYWWHNYANELLEQLQWSLNNQNASRQEKVYLADLKLDVSSQAQWSASRAFNDALKAAYDRYHDEEVFQAAITDLTKNCQWQQQMATRLDSQDFQTDVLDRVRELIVLEQASQNQEQRRG
ncbi:metallophosphoesterase family protein [Aerococcus kribbianus]|uniref:DNA repair exonuclease n=1 Tax=Aerococcus kribbianus TaxID=2999064 RepID=A0A9X3FX09_9LACT|nr:MULTISPECIES: DNA repair exonuclease [unclassified Aerococcus]MCZ0717795.1 DNA repair exonuclease [Aerococcus sp. YH-aer221]MCZ0726082.1 DNA repair exonuclease [Aerococcus sp. YH-aer222]